jgi:putative ATPase
MSKDLFDTIAKKAKKSPLADRMRPKTFEEFVGQTHLVKEGALLREAIEEDSIPSMILWGPPGTGKTTLAMIIAEMTDREFVTFSAVTSGIGLLRQAIERAQDSLKLHGTQTIIFIDEIHRWNKAQQDALLPYVEDGTISLIGATTENPSFEVIGALISRTRVFVLNALDEVSIKALITRALSDKKRGLGGLNVSAHDDALDMLTTFTNGDARVALNVIEFAAHNVKDGTITIDHIKETLQKTNLLYDKAGEEHYNIISALHKSIRASDVNATLYWIGRMIEAGEDPLYIARRLIRAASEDIGLADPQALVQAITAFQAVQFIGMPESNLALVQAAVYLTKAPKSNTLYSSYKALQKDIENLPGYPVPLHLRNAPTKLMKDLGYGKGYVYPPNAKQDIANTYLPDELLNKKWWKE